MLKAHGHEYVMSLIPLQGLLSLADRLPGQLHKASTHLDINDIAAHAVLCVKHQHMNWACKTRCYLQNLRIYLTKEE